MQKKSFRLDDVVIQEECNLPIISKEFLFKKSSYIQDDRTHCSCYDDCRCEGHCGTDGNECDEYWYD
jgi:hypothetical protein